MFFHIVKRATAEQRIYLIRHKMFVDPRFFLQEVLIEPEPAIDFLARWTANPIKAEGFKSEEAVEEFVESCKVVAQESAKPEGNCI